MTAFTPYKYLQLKKDSNYRQLFVLSRIRAEVLYRETIGREPLTVEEYDIPVEAVAESIDYCTRHQDLLDEERAREEAWIRASGHDRWPYAPRNHSASE
ncbi:MAG: hypothetical protein ACYC3I_00380 [Gemmataceae bacterium]